VDDFLIVLQAVLPVFCMAGAGFVIRKVGWLTEEADQSLLRMTINLLVPCLILDSVLGNSALKQLGNVLLAPAVGLATVAVGLGIGLLASGLAGLGDRAKGRSFAFAVGVYNYGYISIPLAVLLFDPETVGVLFVHNVGVEAGIWTLGLLVLSGASLRTSARNLLSPPVVSIVLALGLNAVGGKAWVPEFAVTTTHLLGQCAIPLGLVLVGATIADQLPEFHAEKGWRVMAVACVLRLGVVPVIFLLAAKYLPCSMELKRVLVLQAAMPSAVFPIIVARHYGGDAGTALRVVIGTTAVSFVTIPVWLRFGIPFAGL
jgi:malate permease and related proteins